MLLYSNLKPSNQMQVEQTPPAQHSFTPTYLPPALQFIKDKLDRQSQADSFNGDDIAKMSFDEYEKICNAFIQYFQNEFVDTPKDVEHGLQQKAILVHQLNAVWLYMAFSMYTHHWAPHVKTVARNEKLNKIKGLDAALYAKIGKVIGNIDQTREKYLASTGLNFHEKLPMVSNNLFVYFSILSANPNIDRQALLESLPLTFSPKVLLLLIQYLKREKRLLLVLQK